MDGPFLACSLVKCGRRHFIKVSTFIYRRGRGEDMRALLTRRTRRDRARAWLRRSWTAIRRKLTGTTTRTISTVVVVALVIAIPLLIFVPQWQAAHIANGAARLEREDNARRTILQAIGGAVGLIVIWITWRRLEVAQEGQVTERFSRAIDHLGNDSLDVRLGAIYALERIARDSRRDHGPVMEILTAYVREHAPWKPPSKDQQPAAEDQRLATDIQAALTVTGRRKADYDPPGQRLDLRNTDLHGADLDKANLQGAILAGANLLQAHLKEAKLQDADLGSAILSGAILDEANLLRAVLVRADLREAILDNANLQQAHLTRAKLQRAHLVEAKLPLAHLVGANLQGATLLEAALQGVYLKDANLEEARLTGADLRESDLSQANLRRADLTGTKLQNTSLDYAKMQEAVIARAELQGVDLSGADGLTSQQLVEAKGDEYTKLPPDVERPDHWPAQREDVDWRSPPSGRGI